MLRVRRAAAPVGKLLVVLTDPGDLSYRGLYPNRAPDPFDLPTDVADDSDRPDLPSPAVAEMRDASRLPDALLGGNRRMRTEEWLPREEEETERNHRIRLGRSTCFPFYRDTVCDLAARPFPRELTWDEDPKEQFGAGVAGGLDEFLRDVDGTGKSMTVFSRDSMFWGIHRGMDHTLVDASSTSGNTADVTDARRVYAQRIDPLAMLDIRDGLDEAGRKRVTYCRFVQVQVKRTDTFKQEKETVIVELEKELGDKPGWKLEWRFDATARKWMAGPKAEYNPGKKGIPLFTWYTNQVGQYQAEPLLEDLAWVNLAHFQSRSDHAHVMRIARLITLVTLGFPQPEKTSPLQAKAEHDRIVLGPLSRINSARSPKDASVSFLEPNGKSIELSFQDMEQLADEAKRLGARHLTSKTGNVTARAVSVDDQKSVNNLQTFCLRLEVHLRQVLEAEAEWRNAALPPKVQPRLFKEFQVAGDIEAGSRGLQAIAPALSKRQLLIEASRYGILRPDFPVDENLAELDKEQAAIDAAIAGAAGTPGGHDHPAPDDAGAAA